MWWEGRFFSPPTSFVCLCQSGFNFGSFSLSLSFVIHLILDSKSIFLFSCPHLLLIYYRLFQDFYHCWNKSFVFLFPNLWPFMSLSYCSYFFFFLSLFTSLSFSLFSHFSHTCSQLVLIFPSLCQSILFLFSFLSLYLIYPKFISCHSFLYFHCCVFRICINLFSCQFFFIIY